MNEYSPDPYQVLHLEPAATAGEVTRAYRALMRTHHPDITRPDVVPAERESRAQKLHEIMDAEACPVRESPGMNGRARAGSRLRSSA